EDPLQSNFQPSQSRTLLLLVAWRVQQELAPRFFPSILDFYCHRNLATVAAIHERRQWAFGSILPTSLNADPYGATRNGELGWVRGSTARARWTLKDLTNDKCNENSNCYWRLARDRRETRRSVPETRLQRSRKLTKHHQSKSIRSGRECCTG